MPGGKPVIMVTRPQPGAVRTAERLATMGFEPVLCPLTTIVPAALPQDALPAAEWVATAMTSANAACHAPKWLVEAMAGRPLYAVGAATMQAARERGFARIVHSADGDVDDLAALIRSRCEKASEILYLCGRTRTGDLEGKLRDAGLSATVAEVYETEIVSQMTNKIRDIFSTEPPAGVVFHSAVSAETFSAAFSS